MSIYGCVLFEREHEKVLDGMNKQDNCDTFYGFAYNSYHYYTDEPSTLDRVQAYHFGKMEIFV